MELIAGVITILFGLSLITFLIITLLNKKLATSFLTSFASTANAHYIEQSLRIIVGIGILIYSDRMLVPAIFGIFGWTLTATSALLIIIPWKWHNKFGKRAMPFVIKNLILYAVAASILGLVIMYCAISPLF